MQHLSASERLVTALDSNESDEGRRCKHICLCGNESPHAKRDDCIVARPGTPWWKALNDAEEGDEVEVALPGRTVRLMVVAVERLVTKHAA